MVPGLRKFSCLSFPSSPRTWPSLTVSVLSYCLSIAALAQEPRVELHPAAFGRSSLRSLQSEVTHLPLGVAEDDSLGDGQRVVEVTQSVKLPFLSFHRHEELLDAFQSQFITGGQINAHVTLQTRTRGARPPKSAQPLSLLPQRAGS